jgi:hypothetical protein
MQTNFPKASITCLLGGLIFIFLITSCASEMYLLRGENQKSYKITNASYDKAFSSAIRTITEMGYGINASDKASGTFQATKGSGFGELSQLNFFLREETQENLIFMLRVKSSKGSESVMKEFVDNYGKYITVSPKVSE